MSISNEPQINLVNSQPHLDREAGQFSNSLKCWFGQHHTSNSVILAF
jgi:hypothetical protein